MNEELSYEKNFSKQSFWKKININWKNAGKKIIQVALELYYSLMDGDTPKWAKGVIMGALGYFIVPIDIIPDIAPIIGFSDDLGVMLSAIAVVAVHIKDDHRKKAKEFASRMFGES